MKLQKFVQNLVLTGLGLALAAFGLIILKRNYFAAFPAAGGLLVGVGCCLFGANLGAFIQKKVYQTHPEEAKKVEIEQGDERNRTISSLAKSKAFDAMLYIYSAVMLALVFMGADTVVVLTLVCAYLVVCGVSVYWLSKLQKEM